MQLCTHMCQYHSVTLNKANHHFPKSKLSSGYSILKRLVLQVMGTFPETFHLGNF